MKGKRQVSRRMFKAVACGWFLLATVVAQAADFSVGRVDIRFAEEGWKELPLPDQTVAYGGDRSGALAVEAKLFVRDAPGPEGSILVLVSANSRGLGGGRGGYMTYTPDCKSDAHNYREGNEGFRASFAQCLTVTPLYSGASVFKALAPQVLEAQPADNPQALPPVYTVWSRHAISTGSFVDVRVFLGAPIRGDGASASGELPSGVLPEHVVWGRQLRDAVKSSVYSLSGRLDMPAIRLTPPATGGTAGGG